jgi:hypothetical protein
MRAGNPCASSGTMRLRYKTLGSGEANRRDAYETSVLPTRLESCLLNCLQDDPRILSSLPKFGIETFPQFAGCMIPGPMQVKRQLRELIDPLNL